MTTPAPTSRSDWAAYNAAQAGRGRIRPLTARAVDALAADADLRARHAVELGCGAGIEARHLLALGLTVSTIDADPSIAPAMAALAAGGALDHRTGRIEDWDPLPAADLVLANAALPFVPRHAFDAVWSRIRAALAPGGVLAVDLFGAEDDWSSDAGTYLTRPEVEDLLRGLEVVELTERSERGPAFSGPKHWHVFTVIARAPRRPSDHSPM